MRAVVLAEGLGIADDLPRRVANVEHRLELSAAAEPAKGVLVLGVVRQPLCGEVLKEAVLTSVLWIWTWI